MNIALLLHKRYITIVLLLSLAGPPPPTTNTTTTLIIIIMMMMGLFKGFYIEIRHKVVAKNHFSPLFVLYALKDRKIKLTPRILCHRKIFRCLKMNFRVQT